VNKEARYVVRLAHAETYTPADQASLLTRVREKVHPLKGSALNLRVSRRAIEFDLFCAPELELHPFLSALEPLGAILSYKRLDGSPVPTPVVRAEVVAEARGLFNEERYWEAHEVLEGIWKNAQGQEKQLIQGMILTAAALVHAQKNEPAVVGPMLEDAARRLENQPAVYYGLDLHRFLQHVKKINLSKTPHFPTI
jgi:uncharacterized protein